MSPLVLLIIIIAAGVGIGIIAWFVMRTKSSNRMSLATKRFFGKPKVQPVILIGEDNVAHLMEFSIPLPSFVMNLEKDCVWHLVNSLMLPMQGMIRHVLVLNERNTVPYNPFVKLTPTREAKIKDLDAIADEGGRNAVVAGIKASRNNMIASALIICACAVAFVFLLFIGYQFWQNGGINIGGGGSVK